MCDRIWEHVRSGHGFERADPADLADRATAARAFERCAAGRASRGSAVRRSGPRSTACWAIGPCREMGRAAGQLPAPRRHRLGRPLVVWHNDFVPFEAAPRLRSVQMFVLLNDIRPRGGATLVLTGSHHLVGGTPTPPKTGRIRNGSGVISARLTRGCGNCGWRPRLRPDPALPGRRLRGGRRTPARGRAGGRAGDVFFMHCDTFHTAAPNCLDQPRMMATNMIRLEHRIDVVRPVAACLDFRVLAPASWGGLHA